ncbi:MAG TPA: pyruvate, phosphate dikinase [Syntrophales bacterium]|nr:pyruvate, phosphate dikinase [Syntrophales bacterium]
MAKRRKYVFSFTEGDGKNKMLLGGKGANLCEMTQIGINVPPGFVISTEACLDYLTGGALPQGLRGEVRSHIRNVEDSAGRQFGSPENPLLVSVRSGSAMSMPGMMDTILNLGLNGRTVPGLAGQTGNESFAYDAYRRFLQLFGKISLGAPDELFDEKMNEIRKRSGTGQDPDLSPEHLKELCGEFLEIIRAHTGKPFPQDPWEQLEIAIQAVFRSWNGRRAVDYRRQFRITPEMANGTAVNIQAMVFGNMGPDSATGVAFTRNPATGENGIFGEYLTNAQGEDVVAGIRTPKPVADMEMEMPGIYRQLVSLRDRLESHYREVQDFEFTIERGVLYCLQTRNAKMNAQALVRTSAEMFEENILSRDQALLRIDPMSLEQLLAPRLAPSQIDEPLARGLPASPGAASGAIVFDADAAKERGEAKEKVILVREETKPEDIHGFFAAAGILTSRGGKTSHAAVVARSMGKPCVSGCEQLEINLRAHTARIGSRTLAAGDVITIDGSTGNVYAGEVPVIEAGFGDDLAKILQWSDEAAELKVMANADTPEAAEKARQFGAAGVGLCRTERMFNEPDRLPVVQKLILAETDDARREAIDALLPVQREDFKSIFRIMEGLPVTVRLLDPPLHEFLPSAGALENEILNLRHMMHRNLAGNLEDLAEALRLVDPSLHRKFREDLKRLHGSLSGIDSARTIEALLRSRESLLKKVNNLREVNPMLGHRGVRLGMSFPEIYIMQIRAILEAVAECSREGVDVRAEIMVPQVVTWEELKRVHEYVEKVRAYVEQRYSLKLSFRFGSMIETVRACMRAERLTQVADFFSFGTNDLTQAAFSFSREDAESKFLPLYTESGILQSNPFEALDVKGVGRLMEMTVMLGRQMKPDLKVGICGEHGGHPESIRFCHSIKLNYVSCSPPRVPIARLAAAHARLKEKEYAAADRSEAFIGKLLKIQPKKIKRLKLANV